MAKEKENVPKIGFGSVFSEELGEEYRFAKHQSGLGIYVFPKKISVTYALLCVKFGSAYYRYIDKTGNTHVLPDGTAHFLEHKMFGNADGSDSFETFTALGADSNAYTTHNRTVYLFNCTERFQECLEELITFVTNPYFDEDSVEREKGIIEQEILMYEDNPYNKCYELLLRAMYEKNPVRRNVCGSTQSIKGIDPKTLYECHESFYTADNMVLVVCGDVDENQVFRITDNVLNNNPSVRDRGTSEPDKSIFDESGKPYKIFDSEKMSVSRPILCLGYKITDKAEDRLERQMHEISLMILNELIFSHSGELYNALYAEKLISSWFSSSLTYTDDFSNVTVCTETDVPKTVAERIVSYVQSLLTFGISDSDFERCRRVVYSEFVASFDSTEEIAENLLDSAMNGVDLFDYARLTESLTKEYSEEILKRFFREEYATHVVIYPKTQR